METRIESAKERLRKVRINDTIGEIEGMLKTVKNEQYKLLTDFMTLSYEDLDVYMDITKDGEYVLTVKAVSSKLIDIGKLI
ncbi:MAG: hypothetical protein E7353_03125 [Clostridiales bacterium]|nr:hypothetical protein [Clostridiales bacterium]